MNTILLIAACVASVATTLGGVQYLITILIDKKLAQFENSLLVRINGTYVRTLEMDMLMGKVDSDHVFFKEAIGGLKDGLEYIRKRQDELMLDRH